MSQRFHASQWVPYPVELVFAFFANPSNLAHMFPPALRARVEDIRMAPAPLRPVAHDPARRFLSVAAGAGSEILISFRPARWIPTRVTWLARIVEFTWNSHFADEQARGPFQVFRHRHAIVAEWRDGQEGTLVTDEIEFALGYGWIGRIAEGVVKRRLRQSFAFRHRRLPEILSIASSQASRRG